MFVIPLLSTKLKLWFLPLSVLLCLAFGTQESYGQCSANIRSVTKVCAKTDVSFEATDSTPGRKYKWNFGDPFSGILNEDSIRNTAHYFSDSGTYTITLIVSDTNCADTQTTTLRVAAAPSINYTLNNGCKGLLATFTNTSQPGNYDSIISYNWDLGNGNSSSLQHPSQTYGTTGSYSITLITLTAAGCRDTVIRKFDIYKTPSGSRVQTEICKNGKVDFKGDTLYKATSYKWFFGDSSSFVQKDVSHVFTKAGVFKPFLVVSYPLTSCTTKIDSIIVNKLPESDFQVLQDTFCFNYNQVCLKLGHPDASLTARSVIFDDGFEYDVAPFSDSFICHKYQDTGGGSYSLTVELIDSNGCISSTTQKNVVVILPHVKADFDFPAGDGCFKTSVDIENLSNKTPPLITKYRWDFGDGTIDSTNWTNFSHTYTINGSFIIKLVIEDKYGCADTLIAGQAVQNTNFVVDAVIDTLQGICFNNNFARFIQTPVPGGTIEWSFGNGYKSPLFTALHSYGAPGVYRPFVTISKNGCDSTTLLDTIVIHGPVAAFGAIQNRYQCQVKDTVYFQNNSALFRNKSAVVKWSSGDYIGNTCTTSTKDGINVGMNCKFSTDSASFKYMYPKGIDTCYYATLTVTDTVLGCSHTTFAAVPMMRPKAKGLFVPSDTTPCPGPEPYKTVTFNNALPKPQCLKYAWWVMWDSLEARRSGNFDSYWRFNSGGYNYSYSQYAGDSNGYVSIGLIVENGMDTNGLICRDTGWFHHIVRVTRVSPNFSSSYTPSQYYCPGSDFVFYPIDSTQKTASRFVWDFADGSIVSTTSQGYQTHRFKRSGVYRVRLTIFDSSGCSVDSSMLVNIGFRPDFYTSSTFECIGDSFQIFENNRYYKNTVGTTAYWSDSSRASIETLQWNLGDGSGFNTLGPNPVVRINTPGVYAISMAATDSVGCKDTLFNFVNIRVSGIYAGFILPADTVLCAQTLKIKTSASTTDWPSGRKLAGDTITNWEYDFGNVYARSYLPDPARYFATGVYNIRQVVTNNNGCRDTAFKTMVVTGPESDFEITSDTIGCAPLAIRFKNKSKNAGSYSWIFADVSNSTFSTNSDTAVTFKYRGYGEFYPRLSAQGSFTINGVTRVCYDIFPDTSLSLKKTVVVWEQPTPNFVWKTNCATGTTAFTNTSFMRSSSSIVSQYWDFGDGTGSNALNPTHTFPDTGMYRIVLHVVSNHGCEDSIVRNIMISPQPIAYFGFTPTCIGKSTFFRDSSIAYNDRIYRWNWNFGDNTVSTQQNPTKLYGYDTTYNVSLTITNVAGCVETVSRSITIFSRPKPRFTFANVCDKETVFFKNTSSSKQAVQSQTWYRGDGSSTQTWNDTHLYAAYGAKNVKLVLETVRGCKDSLTQTLQVYPNPVAKIHIPVLEQCRKGNRFTFVDSSVIAAGSTLSFWKLGNGSTDTRDSFTYSYPTHGTYNVRLLSKSLQGCLDSTFTDVNVHPNPVAKIKTPKSAQCVRYNTFPFTDSTSIALGSHQVFWNFGDGSTSTQFNPTHSYSDSGNYTVTLIAESDQGCRDTTTTKVRTHPMPFANFRNLDSLQCLRKNQFLFNNNTQNPPRDTSAFYWEFGDGNSTFFTSPTHSYATYGTYTVLMTATSRKGCVDSIYQPLEVYPMPKAGFNYAEDSAQCLRQNAYTLTNTSSIPYSTLQYNWNFGDGNTDNSTHTYHNYAAEGTYIIRLISTSNFSCADTLSKKVTVHPMPRVGFTINDSTQCINNQQFVFNDISSISSGSLSRQWQLGDSSTSLIASPSKQYKYPGIKWVKLVQFSNKGCGDSLSKTVQVYDKPYARIAVNDTQQCLRGNVFQFINNTSINNGSLGYIWLFGDSSSAVTNNPSHRFQYHRVHTVTLQALSNQACGDTTQLQVEVYPMPFSKFDIIDSAQCLRQNNFSFLNQSYIAYGSLNYQWSFGDTSQSVATSPTHRYFRHASFPIRLITTSNKNCADTASDVARVDPMPIPNFRINDTAQCINKQQFIFTDISSIFSGTLQRTWTFADSIKNNSPVIRTFSSDTTHCISLSLISNYGCQDSIKKSIVVHSKPVPAYSTQDNRQCYRQHVYVVTNRSSIRKGSLSYLWDFGDGRITDSLAPIHRYAQYGNYAPVLKAISEKGCEDTISIPLRVDPMPVSKFSIDDTGQCIDHQRFNFTDLSTVAEGSISPFWKFGDGTTSLLSNPNKQYNLDTNFTVWHISSSDQGCIDSSSAVVDVYPRPNIRFLINDTVQCLRQNNVVFTNASSIKYGSLQHRWYFGDGDSALSLDASHIYKTHATFLAILSVTSNLGCTDSLTDTVTIGAMPRPDFAINDPGQCIRPQNFVFQNNGSIASGMFNSLWHFGDTDTAQQLNSSHKYPTHGKYTVRNILTSNYGCMDSLDKVVWVYPNSNARFTTNDSDQCANQQNYIFTNTSAIPTGNIKSIRWELGNGKSGTSQIINSYYPSSGSYRILLETTSDSGCLDSFYNLIKVYPKPASAFLVNDSAQCLFQNDYLFTDNSFDSIGVNLYQWNINGEQTQTTKAANYIFKTPGYKKITLVSTSLRGCRDTISRLVYVKPMPDPVFETLKTFYCEYTGPYSFTPRTAGGTFYGKNIQNNNYNPVVLWLDTIKYILTVNGCTDSSSQTTQVYPGPRVELGNDTTLCKYEILELKVNSWQSQFVWDNGSTLDSRRITKPGIYSVKVTNICGQKSDTIQVQYRDINCRFFLPTAFTPNEDGINDRYKPITYGVDEMEYRIYNRWGEKIYEGVAGDAGWDGTYLGLPVANGTFVITVSYKYDLGYRQVRETAESVFELMR